MALTQAKFIIIEDTKSTWKNDLPQRPSLNAWRRSGAANEPRGAENERFGEAQMKAGITRCVNGLKE